MGGDSGNRNCGQTHRQTDTHTDRILLLGFDSMQAACICRVLKRRVGDKHCTKLKGRRVLVDRIEENFFSLTLTLILPDILVIWARLIVALEEFWH